MSRNTRTFEQDIELRAKLRRCMLADMGPKAAAAETGIKSVSWLYTLTTAMGFRSMHVTEEERARLMADRRKEISV